MTRKDAAKVAAKLLDINGRGYDAAAVKREAATRMRMGHSAKSAWQLAFDKLTEITPSLARDLQQIDTLIDASSIGTVARYNVALRQYLETGNSSGLAAMVPTMVKDAHDLAKRNGEAPPDFGPEADALVEAANTPAPPPPTDVYVNSSQARPASFQFAEPETAPAPQGNL